jgi:hypothetical protein
MYLKLSGKKYNPEENQVVFPVAQNCIVLDDDGTPQLLRDVHSVPPTFHEDDVVRPSDAPPFGRESTKLVARKVLNNRITPMLDIAFQELTAPYLIQVVVRSDATIPGSAFFNYALIVTSEYEDPSRPGHHMKALAFSPVFTFLCLTLSNSDSSTLASIN